VGAGAYDALERQKLLKAPASAEICARVMGALHGKLLSEGESGAARRIERLQTRLSTVFEGWPERIFEQAQDVSPRDDFDAHFVPFEGVDNFANYDNLSANYDNLSLAHYKEGSPQGSLKARGGPRGPVDFSKQNPGAQSDEVLPSLSLAHIAAIAGGSARRRAAIAEALIGCQAATADGWLWIRTSGQAQCDQLHEVWFADLLSAAQTQGYRGLFITDRTATVLSTNSTGGTDVCS